MKKILALSLLCFCFSNLLAQSRVVILGTAHVRSERFNPDSIIAVMDKFKPDIILMELDTSLMDVSGNLKGKAAASDENEEVAMRRYKKQHPETYIRCFDIEYRSLYYQTHQTFATEASLDRAIDSLWHHNGLDRESMQIISALNRLNSALDIIMDMGITAMNSKEYKELAGLRQNWMYNKRLAVIARTPALRGYYNFYKDDGEFWDTRNKRMINNIVSYAKAFKGKKILVLTGAMHTYYQISGLISLQNEFGFKLVDPPLGN